MLSLQKIFNSSNWASFSSTAISLASKSLLSLNGDCKYKTCPHYFIKNTGIIKVSKNDLLFSKRLVNELFGGGMGLNGILYFSLSSVGLLAPSDLVEASWNLDSACSRSVSINWILLVKVATSASALNQNNYKDR